MLVRQLTLRGMDIECAACVIEPRNNFVAGADALIGDDYRNQRLSVWLHELAFIGADLCACFT